MPYLGLGLQAFGNVNPRPVFGGVVTFLQFGALRR